MKRTAIADLTQEQAMDELTMEAVKKLLKKAKKAYKKAQEAEANVFQALEDMCLDLEAPSDAENANNLVEAVSCWLNYDEYSLSGIMKEIKAQYTRGAHNGL